MREVWNSIRYNIQRVLQSDPAATSWFMVVWTYPHITALFWHFFAHRLYRKGWFTLARRVTSGNGYRDSSRSANWERFIY